MKTKKKAERVNDFSNCENAIYWISRQTTYGKATVKHIDLFQSDSYKRLTQYNKGRISAKLDSLAYTYGKDSHGRQLCYQLFDDMIRVGGQWMDAKGNNGTLLACSAMGGFRRALIWKDCELARMLGCVGKIYQLCKFAPSENTKELARKINEKRKSETKSVTQA